MSEQDRIFAKNFALVIAGLVAFTLAIIVLAWNLNDLANRPDDPNAVVEVEARIAPVGDVFAGETGAAAAAAATAAPEPTSVAYDGALDGALIYEGVCAACHLAGVAGAPKLEQAAWDARIATGMDTMVDHAIQGYQGNAGYMPPRGGRMDLSDEQVRVTVQWMVDNLE